MPGSPVLLGSYASRVLPWVAGVLSSCHPSGGASLVLQSLVGLGGAPPDIRRACFLSDCSLKSCPWPRLGVLGIPCLGFSVALLPGAGAVSFAFVVVVTCSGTSLAPRLAGFHCAGPANARQIAWEKVIACGGGQVFLVRLG